MSAKQPATSERRNNQPIRVQAQKWFDALRAHLAGTGSNNDVADRLQHWSTLEDVLADCPRLLPPLLNMAWQLRHLPAFAEHFQTASGNLAEDTSAPLKPCGKSFDAVVLSHLQGAMRVYCDRQEKEFLEGERARHRPTGIATIKFIAPIIQRLRRHRDKDFLAYYPQHELYLTLKPHLRYPHQFGLIEALATLPTTTVKILGDTTRGLIHDSAIRNLAALESRKCKFMVGLARVFADTVITEVTAAVQAGAPEPNMTPQPIRANLPDMAGMSLSYLAIDGLHLSKGAIAVRDQARDIVIKMSMPMGYQLWRVFATSDGAMSIAHCPAIMARALGENATRVPHKTSEALNSLPDKRIIEPIVSSLVAAAGYEAFVVWATKPTCTSGWVRMVTEIKKVLTQQGEGAVTPENIAAFCQSLVPSFTALSADSQTMPVEAAPAEPTPA